MELLTVLMTYGAVKAVILYYSGPLNIEIAEACVKQSHETVEESINASTRIARWGGPGKTSHKTVTDEALNTLEGASAKKFYNMPGVRNIIRKFADFSLQGSFGSMGFLGNLTADI